MIKTQKGEHDVRNEKAMWHEDMQKITLASRSLVGIVLAYPRSGIKTKYETKTISSQKLSGKNSEGK